MNELLHNIQLHGLVGTYFSNPERRLTLNPGDMLTRENDFNDRLFLILNGRFSVYVTGPDGERLLLFTLEPGMFAGVISFFSGEYLGAADVVADAPAEVAYIDQHTETEANTAGSTLAEQFMPVIIADLSHRQLRAREISLDKERALKNLIESEKLASLGQMAAGITHELNNALAVIQRGTVWLLDHIPALINDKNEAAKTHFQKGKETGRSLNSREIRSRKRQLHKRYPDADELLLERLAECGIENDELPRSQRKLKQIAKEIVDYWETGATLRGMEIAAGHARHVAKSVKSLGAQTSQRLPDQDVNESLREAMTLLRSKLRQVNISTDFKPLPGITANKGELVQIWINIIKNACESLIVSQLSTPTIDIRSRKRKGLIKVDIADNGPGIVQELIPKIFQPNFTTKISGLTFGLGLGLSIVQRIVRSYGGEITVDSAPGRTVFSITLPVTPPNITERPRLQEDPQS